MKFTIIRDPNIIRFFEEYPQYRTARIYEYAPAEFMAAFGSDVGYWDFWDWANGPEIYAELFYIQKGEHFEVLPHFAKSGSASSGESAVELVGNIDVLKNLLKDYEGIVIYIIIGKKGGEKELRRKLYTPISRKGR